ncbi:hypothetical protein BHE74_00024129 [Ensete ventricosum]|nr:hypothetical protein BHE74_00024129 [Ensete ventricosum]
MEKFQSGLWRFCAIFRRRDREFEKRSPCKLQWRVFIPIKRRGTTFNGCSAFGRTVGTILRQAAPSLVRRISISGSDNREYNAQSNRRDLRPGVSGLLGCGGGHPCDPRADTSRLTGRVNVAANVALDTATVYCLLRSLVEHSCINLKSLAFGYLNEKPIDIGLMKFLGLCPSALSWYFEFTSAFSTSSAPFTTNALPL